MKILKALISINTSSNSNWSKNPDITRALKLIEEFLGNTNFEYHYITSDSYSDSLLVKSKNFVRGEKVITLSAHIDTVISMDEVPVKIEDGKFYGSGTQNMKGGIVVILNVLKKLEKEGNLKNIYFTISSEEEIGLPNQYSNFEKVAKESNFIFIFESTLDKEPNAPLNKRSIVLKRKGFKQFQFSISGPGGHSGILEAKEERINTNLIMSEFLLELEKLSDYENRVTINPGILYGGKKINEITKETTLSFECRFFSTELLGILEKKILELLNIFQKKYPKASFTFEKLTYFPPLEYNSNHEGFFDKMITIGESIGLEVVKESRAGGSEASVFSEFNPDAVIVDGMGVRGEHQHTKSEYLYIESIDTSTDFTLEIIKYIQSLDAK